MNQDKQAQAPAEPWWKFGHVWLVIAGPCVVVVAGIVTAVIAMSSPDPVLAEDYYRKGVEISKTLANDKALMPALQGRNHAATPTTAGRLSGADEGAGPCGTRI